MKQHSVIIYTYIYHVGPFKFRWSIRTLYNLPFIFAEGVIIQVIPGRWDLYYHAVNISGKWCYVLTIIWIWRVLLDRHSAVSWTAISGLKIIYWWLSTFPTIYNSPCAIQLLFLQTNVQRRLLTLKNFLKLTYFKLYNGL